MNFTKAILSLALIFLFTQACSTSKQPSSKTAQQLHDIWSAIRIDGNPIDRSQSVPNLELNLTEMRVMGSDGCNTYRGDIKGVDGTTLEFGALASTRKACRNMQVPAAFNQAMTRVKGYRLAGLNLILTDEAGKEVVAFLKAD